MITLHDVYKSYTVGEAPISVLRGLSLEIKRGEFVAIMGPSGSGKSTLLNIIGCLDTLDTGRYNLGDAPVSTLSDDGLADIRLRRFGFVFQLFNLIPRINALRNVELPMVYARIQPIERRKRALQALEAVGLGDRASHSPAQLSGGQQQRVAIARALVNDPDVIIADEPTGSLDSRAGAEIMQLFRSLNANGKTVVMVTHEEDIAGHAKRVIRLRDGVIERDERSTH